MKIKTFVRLIKIYTNGLLIEAVEKLRPKRSIVWKRTRDVLVDRKLRKESKHV